MVKFKAFLSIALDFLFPQNPSVQAIQTSSAETLLETLPASDRGNFKTAEADICALFAYRDERVKHLVWEIKYYRNEKVTDTVGALIAERIKKMTAMTATHSSKHSSEHSRTETFFLVPIPLTAKRLRERGYNHTELLAKAIYAHLHVPEHFKLTSDFLKKVRHTPKQHSIENREDRFTNIAGAFEVPESQREHIKGAHILLIDDVVTTGATVNEAKRALLCAGAKSVQIFAIAH